MFSGGRRRRRLGHRRRRGGRQRRPTQHDAENRALAGRGLHLQRAAHQLHQPLGDDQPDAGALDRSALGAQAVEGLEQRRLLRGAEPGAGVGHADRHQAFAGLHAHRHAAPGPVVLAGVGQQVAHHLAQPGGVGLGGQGLVAGLDEHRHLCRLRDRADHAHAVGQQRRQRDRVARDDHRAGLDAREVQHVVDQLQQVPAGGLDMAQLLVHARRRRLQAQPQHLREAQDGVQRRAQLVAHAREELGLRTVRALGGVARRGQLGGAGGDPLLELVVGPLQCALGLLQRGHTLLQRLRHAVEGQGELRRLVAALHRQRDAALARGEPVRAVGQRLQPARQQTRQRHLQQRRGDQPDQADGDQTAQDVALGDAQRPVGDAEAVAAEGTAVERQRALEVEGAAAGPQPLDVAGLGRRALHRHRAAGACEDAPARFVHLDIDEGAVLDQQLQQFLGRRQVARGDQRCHRGAEQVLVAQRRAGDLVDQRALQQPVGRQQRGRRHGGEDQQGRDDEFGAQRSHRRRW
jgi:hypothetical protein